MMHKNVGYMIKCKENSLYSPEFITKWYIIYFYWFNSRC